MSNGLFSSRSYQMSRRCIVAVAAVEYFISLCITSTLLTALLNEMKVDPALHGIIGSIISLACVSQLFSVFWIKKSYPAKRWICVLSLVSQLMFLLLYCIPFIRVSTTVKLVAFIAILLGAYLFQHFLTPSRIQWHMSLVNDAERGVFTAKKEIISLIGGIVFSQIAGLLIDYYKGKGDMRTCFILFASTIALLSLLNFSLLLSIKEPVPNAQPKRKGFTEIVALIFQSKKLCRVLLFDILYNISSVSITFLSVYAMANDDNPNTLGLSATWMMSVSIAFSIVRSLVSVPLGKFADKHSFAALLRLCLSVMTVGYVCLTFCVPHTGTVALVLYVTFYLCRAFSMAGTNSSLINLCFDYVEHDDRRYILGVKNALSGVAAFLTSLLWGLIVRALQLRGNSLFGITVYPQQILFAISAMITLVLVTLVLPGLKKEPTSADKG